MRGGGAVEGVFAACAGATVFLYMRRAAVGEHPLHGTAPTHAEKGPTAVFPLLFDAFVALLFRNRVENAEFHNRVEKCGMKYVCSVEKSGKRG